MLFDLFSTAFDTILPLPEEWHEWEIQARQVYEAPLTRALGAMFIRELTASVSAEAIAKFGKDTAGGLFLKLQVSAYFPENRSISL